MHLSWRFCGDNSFSRGGASVAATKAGPEAGVDSLLLALAESLATAALPVVALDVAETIWAAVGARTSWA